MFNSHVDVVPADDLPTGPNVRRSTALSPAGMCTGEVPVT